MRKSKQKEACLLTKNQIDYWALKETQRSNLAKEGETSRHNQVTEAHAWADLSETTRHNQANEFIAQGNLDESERHNRATETVNLIKAEADLEKSHEQTKRWDNQTINEYIKSGTYIVDALIPG